MNNLPNPSSTLSPDKKTPETAKYNSTLKPLKLPEYGRLVQNMVDYALTIENREERQRYAAAIVSVMAGLNPQMRDVADFRHKLWDHLAYISDYKLDIDYPFSIVRQDVKVRPHPIEYPCNDIRFRHYGNLVERAMVKLSEMEEGAERDNLIRLIANRMKRNLADWKGDGVEDSKVAHDINLFTEGRVEPDFTEKSLMRITDNKFRTRKYKAQY